MKTTQILIALASVTTAVLPFSLFFAYATTGALIASVSAWLALGFVKSYGARQQTALPRLRGGMIAAAACCPKSSLRLAA